MPKTSAGLLLYRRRNGVLEVFLVHPGGPFWAKEDDGAWSIPKGEFAAGEDSVKAARRGVTLENRVWVRGDLIPASPIKETHGEGVYIWIVVAEQHSALVVRHNLTPQRR